MTERQKRKIAAAQTVHEKSIKARDGLARLGLVPADYWLETHSRELDTNGWAPIDLDMLATLIAMAEGRKTQA